MSPQIIFSIAQLCAIGTLEIENICHHQNYRAHNLTVPSVQPQFHCMLLLCQLQMYASSYCHQIVVEGSTAN